MMCRDQHSQNCVVLLYANYFSQFDIIYLAVAHVVKTQFKMEVVCYNEYYVNSKPLT